MNNIWTIKTILYGFIFLIVLLSGCKDSAINSVNNKLQRNDEARKIDIKIKGSLQNPCWSPDQKTILFTNYRSGYNKGPADLLLYDLEKDSVTTLVSNGYDNVNLPGSSWNKKLGKIVFSSSQNPHDEIYIINEKGKSGQEKKITNRSNALSYEPSISPDGKYIVFETHIVSMEKKGLITIFQIGGNGLYRALTDFDEDCRQPNWSPSGERILYQKKSNGQWDIWVTDIKGKNHRKVTDGSGDKTDATFSQDGKWIVYSSEEGDLELANIYIIPVIGGKPYRITNHKGYDGAPSWSPDGTHVIFESSPDNPDGSKGASIWMIEARVP